MDFWKALAKYLGTMILLFVVLAVVLRVFYVDIVYVGDNAMAPTLLSGERVIIWRLSELGPGDIGICEKPRRPGVPEFVIGRVVARGGQRVETRDGLIAINGVIQDTTLDRQIEFENRVQRRRERPWLGEEEIDGTAHAIFASKLAPLSIRQTQVSNGLYLLGDNRTMTSEDSRTLGEFEVNRCRGRVFMRLSPTEHAEDLDHGWLQNIH